MKVTFEISDNPPVENDQNPCLFNGIMINEVYGKHYEVKHLNFYGKDLLLSLPLAFKGGLPGKKLILPQFIPYYNITPCISGELSARKRHAVEQNLYANLATALDSLGCAIIDINFLPFSWTPMYWAGFNVKPRVTYRLETAVEQSEILSNFRLNIQRHIKKSEELHNVEISNDFDLLFNLNKASYERKNDKHPFDSDILNKLCSYLIKSKKGKLLVAKNANNQPIAATLFGCDKDRVYYLTGGVLTEFKSEGVMPRLLWEGIKWAKSLGVEFDFEGSMNQNIAEFFASFGAQPYTYYQISKSNSKIYDLYKTLKP